MAAYIADDDQLNTSQNRRWNARTVKVASILQAKLKDDVSTLLSANAIFF